MIQLLINMMSALIGPERVAFLLGVDLPANNASALGPLQLDYRGLMPWWLGLFFVLVLSMGVFVLYVFEKGTLGWLRRIPLFLIRTAVLGLVVWLLLRPVLVLEFNSERPKSIYFLLDNSQSMKQQDHRVTNKDRMRVAIAEGIKPLKTEGELTDSEANIPRNVSKDPSRQKMVEWILNHKELHLFEDLEKKGPLQPFLFGARFTSPHESLVSAPAKSEQTKTKTPEKHKPSIKDVVLQSFSADESKTALYDSIIGLLQKKDSELPAAMVIITDGQDNSSKYALQEAARFCASKDVRVPLHIYGVGSPDGGVLKLKDVAAADTWFVDDNIQIPFSYAAHGFKEGAFEFTLEIGDGKRGYKPVTMNVDGKKLDRKTVRVKDKLPNGAEKVNLGPDLRDALEFTLAKDMVDSWLNTKEFVNFKIKAVYRDKSLKETYETTAVRQVRVVDRKIKLLVIETAPRWEWRFLQAALMRDRRIEPVFYLINADPKITAGMPYIPRLPETKTKFLEANYDAILLGDVAPSELARSNKKTLDWIREFVQERRGGLIVMAGQQHMPAEYARTPIEEMIPVEFDSKYEAPDSSRERSIEYQPTLTDVGQRTSMMFLDDQAEDNLKIWRSLPGFDWQFPVKKLRAGATQLVVNPRPKLATVAKPGAKKEMPLVATQFYGKGQVFFIGTDETWRWRLNVQDKYFVRFWGQVIYQMGLPHLLGDGAKRVQFALQGGEAMLNNDGDLFVHMVNKDFEPRKDEKVEAELTYLGAKQDESGVSERITLLKVPGRDGEYRVSLKHDRPGRWQVKLNNPGDTAPATFEFRVEIPKLHELDESGMAENDLRTLAKDSGGEFYREEDLYKLADNVQPQSSIITTHEERVLWNNRSLLLFVLLITFEWVVRKFANLS